MAASKLRIRINWKGPLETTYSSPPAQAETAIAGCPWTMVQSGFEYPHRYQWIWMPEDTLYIAPVPGKFTLSVMITIMLCLACGMDCLLF